jgi:hypothetical protein
MEADQLATAATDPDKVDAVSWRNRRSILSPPIAISTGYEGGDTAITLYSSARRMPIARAGRRPAAPGDAFLFLGDMP